MGKEPLSEEQVKVISEIWDLLEKMGKPTSKEEVEKITAPDGVVLPEFKLRAIRLSLKEAHLHGAKPKLETAQSVRHDGHHDDEGTFQPL